MNNNIIKSSLKDEDNKKVDKDDINPILLKLIFEDKSNAFLTGPGGTGKSFIIKKLHKYAILNGVVSAVTASTGTASINVQGVTLHRFFKLGLADKSLDTTLGIIYNNKDAIERIKNVELLFIDEISMVSDDLIDLIDQITQNIRRSKKPFGGIQIVVSGDMLQLPPVDGRYVFLSPLWKRLSFTIIKLTTPYRFIDQNHYQLLSRARVGNLTPDDIKKLNERTKAYQNYLEQKTYEKEEIKPTRFHSRKKDVEIENIKELAKLEGKIFRYISKDTYTPKKSKGNPATAYKNISNNNENNANVKEYTEYFDHLIPSLLQFKVGAQVMLTYNLDLEDNGLCNGSRGVIKECFEDGVQVLFKNNVCVKITNHEYKYKDDRMIASRLQLPLILAYSLTIHRCQGATLDYAILDLGPSIFSPAQGYVALSRVRSLDGILISNFNSRKIYADPIALKFEAEIDKMIKK